MSKAWLLTYAYYSVSNLSMKSHMFISIGLLIGAIFFWRGIEALNEPGLGLKEAYVFGGFVAAGLLVRQGWIDRKNS